MTLQAQPHWFNALLIAGALYLGWFGWSQVQGASAWGEVRAGPTRSTPATFTRGLITCLLNPKANLFLVAVFPQFMRPEHGSPAAQALIMGAIIAATQ